jgi:hypothetical protein
VQREVSLEGKEEKAIVLYLSTAQKPEHGLIIANYRVKIKFIIYNYGTELLF